MPDDPKPTTTDINIEPGGYLWVIAEVCVGVLIVAATWTLLLWLAGAR